jgi:hypothetical protein
MESGRDIRAPDTGPREAPERSGWLLTVGQRLLYALIFTMFAGLTLWPLVFHLRAAHFWVTTPGAILESETVSPPPDKFSVGVTVRVRYRYTVAGQEYISERITTGDAPKFLNIADARSFRLGHRPGQEVTVHYDPWWPSEATLRVEWPGGAWVSLGLFALCAGCAAWMWLSAWRAVRRPGNEPPVINAQDLGPAG